MSTGVLNKAAPAPGGASAHPDGPRLLADVGGTNARFALESGPGEIGQVRVYPCADFPGIADVLQAYLADVGLARVNHAAIAIANPVDGDQVQMTNHDWRFSIEATRRAVGFDTLLVVNDFTALAMALPALGEHQRRQVGAGTRRPQAVIGLVGPGTGLGVSGLVPTDGRWFALASEGGHTSFAPSDEREDYILAYAREQWSHVSFERIAAGPGIVLIYRALARRAGIALAGEYEAADVVELALGGDALAHEALDCFCGVLGTFAGNVAVTLGALGGMYIGGGVVPRLGEFFARSSFRQRFESKGRFHSYLQDVPTYLITAEYPAFLGVSAILSDQLKSRAGARSAVSERIRQSRDALTPAERRVADLALEHPRSLISDPIADIARKADVSQPTVIRFCRTLGCQGLSDFKLKLASELTGAMPLNHSPVQPGDTASDFGAKVLDNTVSALMQLREHINFEQVARAIAMLGEARRIEFYGLGNSSIVAQDAHYKFFRFGVPTIAYGDLYMQKAAAALLGRGDVVVAISRSGKSPELLQVVDMALLAGAEVIAITTTHTPLARKATVALETDPVELADAQLSMIARMLHLVLIDILAVGLALRRAGPPDAMLLPDVGALPGASHGAAGSAPMRERTAREQAARALLGRLSHGSGAAGPESGPDPELGPDPGPGATRPGPV